jgi:SAM-dependent methyltransferase/ribosomal protein S18 acetylase RimI-like enzyme
MSTSETMTHQDWTVRKIVRRAGEVLREEGLRALWFKVLGETVYRRLTLVEYSFESPIHRVESKIPVEVEVLPEDRLSEYLRFRSDSDPDRVVARIREGQECWIARYQGQIVHACWLARHRAWVDYLSCGIELAPGSAYSYEAFTDPEFRGLAISPSRLAAMMQTLAAQGYQRIVAGLMPENLPAFGSVRKVGYRPIGVMGYYRLGPWRRHFCRYAEEWEVPPIRVLREDSASKDVSYAEAAYWDGIVEDMATQAHYLDPFLGEMKRRAHLSLVDRWCPEPSPGWVLKTDLFEEATGPGAFLADLPDNAGPVVGVDLSPAICLEARRRDTQAGAYYVAADVRHLPFSEQAFGLVVSPSTLDHFPDPADLGRSLGGLRRVLKRHGHLILTLDNRQNLFDPLLRMAVRLGRVPYYVGRAYTLTEIADEVRAVGLEARGTTTILHNPRLIAVGAVWLANRLGWLWLKRFVRRVLASAQRLQDTRWQHWTGSFVAVDAVRTDVDGSGEIR